MDLNRHLSKDIKNGDQALFPTLLIIREIQIKTSVSVIAHLSDKWPELGRTWKKACVQCWGNQCGFFQELKFASTM